MRRLVLIGLVSFLLLASVFIHKKGISIVKASPDIHQGDLIITGNDVHTIEGRLDINGSIVVEDNATLILRNAVLNFTQIQDSQYEIILRNPSNGNPHFFAYNSTITSNYRTNIYLEGNSTATFNFSTIDYWIIPKDSSVLSILNSSYVNTQFAYDNSLITVQDSTIGEWQNYGSPTAQVHNSLINSLMIGPRTVDCTIFNLESGYISDWNSITDCLVSLQPGGSTPNLTLTNTIINSWRLGFYGSSNAMISYSVISDLSTFDSSRVTMIDSTIASYIYARHTSVIYLVNSTYYWISSIDDQAKIQVGWYLDVHVIDSNGTDVPSANVTAYYPNATIAETKLTEADGWAMLTLMEKMMNTTGTYPVGSYTIEATYETYSDTTTVNMTENKQITLPLPFIIPEFPSLIVLPLFMIATLLAVIVYRRNVDRTILH